MLFRWIRLHLVFCHFQCLNQTFTGLSRIDDFVDESQLGSLIRSGELFLVGFASALRNRIFTAPSAPITAISALG